MPNHIIELTPAEFDTVIAALRFWQRCGNVETEPEYALACDRQDDPLTDPDIDALIEELNCGFDMKDEET